VIIISQQSKTVASVYHHSNCTVTAVFVYTATETSSTTLFCVTQFQ